MAYVSAIAGPFDLMPVADFDYRRQWLHRDFSGSKRAIERGKAKGIGDAEELHCCSCCERSLGCLNKPLVLQEMIGDESRRV